MSVTIRNAVVQRISGLNSGGGVTSLNSEIGDINLVAGSNITITPSGQNITIASTGSGGGGVEVVIIHSDGSSTPYPAAANTNAARAAAYDTAFTAALDQDTIECCANDFDIGTNTYDMTKGGTMNIRTIGQGMGLTTFNVDAGGLTTERFLPSNLNRCLADFSIISSAPTDSYVYPIGLNTTAPTNLANIPATIENIEIQNWSDGIYFNTSAAFNCQIINCDIVTGFDCINIDMPGSSVIDIIGNKLRSTFTDNLTRGIVNSGGTLNLWNNDVVADGVTFANATEVDAVISDGSSAVTNIFSGTYTAINGANAFDLNNTAGTINVNSCVKYAVTNGTIGFLDSQQIENSLNSFGLANFDLVNGIAIIPILSTNNVIVDDGTGTSIFNTNLGAGLLEVFNNSGQHALTIDYVASSVSTQNNILDNGSGEMEVLGNFVGNYNNDGNVFQWLSANGPSVLTIDGTANTVSTYAGSVLEDGSGNIQPGTNYKASDGTAGGTSTTGGLTFKSGLYTSGSISGLTNPMTTLGDIIYENVSPAPARLAGNISSTKNFLTQTGTGSASAAPAWGTIVGADLPNPSSSTLGGVRSITSVSHNFLTSISTAGIPSQAQPAFTDISGTATTAQLPTITTLGTIATYNGITTAGVGIPYLVANADLLGQTTAVTVTSYANPGARHTYGIGGYLNIIAVTLDVIQFQVAWTDEASNSRTQLFFPMGLTSASLGTTGYNAFPTISISVKASTTITVSTVLTTGTGTIGYDVGAHITKIS